MTLGQDLVVDCRAVSEGPSGGQLTYTWLFNQSAVQPKALLMANTSLFVPRVGQEEEGEYTCVVREAQGAGQATEVQATAQVVIACELKVQFLLILFCIPLFSTSFGRRWGRWWELGWLLVLCM